MAKHNDNLTLLIAPGEKLSSARDLPKMIRVSDPGPSFKRLRRFFRPWRFAGKVLAVGLPCWLAASVVALGGWLTGLASAIAQSLEPIAAAGFSTAVFLGVLPAGILALWAGLVGLYDLAELGQNRHAAKAYNDALARLGDADVITPNDLRSPGIRQGLATLGHFEKLLATVDRAGQRISSLLRDSLYESKRMVYRSVLDLIVTERRLAEWSGRLGESSTYQAKLQARRDKLAQAYPGILDQCLHAADHALARADEDPADLQRSVQSLLDSCQRALAQVERDGPAVDEQELLMYAAKAREAQSEASEKGQSPGPERLDE